MSRGLGIRSNHEGRLVAPKLSSLKDGSNGTVIRQRADPAILRLEASRKGGTSSSRVGHEVVARVGESVAHGLNISCQHISLLSSSSDTYSHVNRDLAHGARSTRRRPALCHRQVSPGQRHGRRGEAIRNNEDEVLRLDGAEGSRGQGAGQRERGLHL